MEPWKEGGRERAGNEGGKGGKGDSLAQLSDL